MRCAEQAALGGAGHQLRQPPPVNQPAFLPAVPAIVERLRQQRLQRARQPRRVDAGLCHRYVQRGAQLGQLRGAHQAAGAGLAVIGGGEGAVAGGAALRCIAGHQGAGQAAVFAGFKVHPNLQPGVFVLVVRGLGVFFGGGCGRGVFGQLRHHRGNRQCVHRKVRLLLAIAAQPGQRVADARNQSEAGRFQQVL